MCHIISPQQFYQRLDWLLRGWCCEEQFHALSIITNRNLKLLREQAFLHDLMNFNWVRITLMDGVNLACKYYSESFIYLVDKHAAFCQVRVKGGRTGSSPGQLRESPTLMPMVKVWQLRNSFTASIRKSKCDYFLILTTDSLKDPGTFWRTINSLSDSFEEH